MPTRFTLASALLALGGPAALAGADVLLTAMLTNDQEVPPAEPTLTDDGDPRPASFGEASLVLNDAQTELTFTVAVFNIDFTGNQTPDDANDDLTVAHIHGGPDVTPDTTGPVVFGFIGNPFNDTNPTDTVVDPFDVGVGGVVTSKWDAAEGNNTTLTEQLDNLLNGRTYFNFHTVQFPSGEIRGAILVPEPSSAALLGLMAVPALRRRR